MRDSLAMGAEGRSFRAALFPLADLPARIVQSWHDLAGRATEPNPFFEPEWVLASARHHGVPSQLLAVMAGSDMVACLPLFGGHRPWRPLPLPIWTVPTSLGTSLVDPEVVRPGLAAALGFLAWRRGMQRILALPWLPTDGPVTAALEAVVAGRCPPWSRGVPAARPRLERRPELTYLEATQSGRHRRELGRERRALERELGQPLEVVERGGDEATVERFLAIEAQGWKGRSGTAMTCLPGRAAFFREMCAGFAADDRLRMLCLEANGTTVAMSCSVVAHQGLFHLKKAYDDRFKRFSPGVLLEIETIRVFHAGGAAWMDSCTNHETDPLFSLWPDSRRFTSLVVTLGGVVGQLAMGGLVPTLRRLRTTLQGGRSA